MQKFSKDRKVMDSFPEDFLWGGATAANQYEVSLFFAQDRAV